MKSKCSFGLTVLLSLCVGCPCVLAADAAESYSFVKMWPELPQQWYFRYPEGVGVYSWGNVYVADTNNDRIQKFSPKEGFIAKWGSRGFGNGKFDWPAGVAVDASGNVYVADTYNHRIQKFRPTAPEIISIGVVESNPSWIELVWPVVPEKSYKIYWTDDVGRELLNWDEVDGAALDDLVDNGDGSRSWTDKGTDPDMAGEAPGEVRSRFYMVGAE